MLHFVVNYTKALITFMGEKMQKEGTSTRLAASGGFHA